jgi:ADP-ribose pyrophosphatase
VELDSGERAPREVVLHGGGVAVVPVLDDEVLLVRQYRVATGEEVLELPAGRLEGPESPEKRAHAELEEEVGYRAGRLELVAACYCSPGFTNEKDYIFLAFDLTETAKRPEWDENLELVRVPVAEVEQRLRDLAFNDAKTIIGLRELLARRSG